MSIESSQRSMRQGNRLETICQRATYLLQTMRIERPITTRDLTRITRILGLVPQPGPVGPPVVGILDFPTYILSDDITFEERRWGQARMIAHRLLHPDQRVHLCLDDTEHVEEADADLFAGYLLVGSDWGHVHWVTDSDVAAWAGVPTERFLHWLALLIGVG